MALDDAHRSRTNPLAGLLDDQGLGGLSRGLAGLDRGREVSGPVMRARATHPDGESER